MGKKLVLIEGDDTSLDKLTYGAILKNRFPNLVLVPSGGKDLIRSFSHIVTGVLERTIWGVEFFMLCDRDAVPLSAITEELESAAAGRLKVLERYHLENYFLDECVLAACFDTLEPESSWLRDPVQVKARLKEIARSMISYATALQIAAQFRTNVGNLDIMPSGCHDKSMAQLAQLMTTRASAELTRISDSAKAQLIEEAVQTAFTTLDKSLNADTEEWKAVIPGKQLLNRFARAANLDVGRLKKMYLKEAEAHSPNPFADIITVFAYFDSLDSAPLG